MKSPFDIFWFLVRSIVAGMSKDGFCYKFLENKPNNNVNFFHTSMSILFTSSFYSLLMLEYVPSFNKKKLNVSKVQKNFHAILPKMYWFCQISYWEFPRKFLQILQTLLQIPLAIKGILEKTLLRMAPDFWKNTKNSSNNFESNTNNSSNI